MKSILDVCSYGAVVFCDQHNFQLVTFNGSTTFNVFTNTGHVNGAECWMNTDCWSNNSASEWPVYRLREYVRRRMAGEL